ncbi:MAG TPA: hypothetical protein VGD80_32745 [Kofleriaceae bacterium]
MRNTPTLAFTLPAFLLAAGCALTEPTEQADNPSTNSTEQAVQFCDIFPSLPCAPSPSVSSASNAPSSLTYATSGWSTCTMTYVLPNGFTDSFPFPTDASGTAGAGSGVRYTLSCSLLSGSITIISTAVTTLVF